MGTGWTSPLRLLVVCVWVAALAGLGGCEWGEDPAPGDPPPDGLIGDSDSDTDINGIGDDDGNGVEIPDFGDPAAPLFTDAALSPDGRFLLVQVGAEPCLTVADLQEGTADKPAGLCGIRWIGFAPDGIVAYLLLASGTTLATLQLSDLSVSAEVQTTGEYTVLDVSPDGATVALSNVPTTLWTETQYEWNTDDPGMRRLATLRPGTGTVAELSTPFALRDVAFSPVDGVILGVSSRWKNDGWPEAQVYWIDPVTGVIEDQIAFLNCADELALQPGGILALLSPNQCMVHPVVLPPPPEVEEWPSTPEEEWEDWEDWDDGDPVSVIDLETRTFEGNLPGFGPLAFSPDGETAVAFSRRETLMTQWNVFQQSFVGLVFIRMADLYWSVLEYGDDEPDYFFEPSGAHLYLHDREPGQDRIVRLDLATEAMAVLEGPPTHLDGHTLAPDGAMIYVIAGGQLRRVPVGGAAIEAMPLPFTPSQVFARPQGDALVVTEAENASVYLVDPVEGEVLSSIEL
ncbi:MAG: hypothetical protein ABIK09_02885 [Pseudomonadota bacterium]